MAATPPVCDFGRLAPDFSLPATDGKTYSRDDLKGPNGLLVVFICNHCPYVKSITDKLVRDANALKELGINMVAICSNDATTHPDDSFENMQKFAAERSFTFPYLHDEDQSVARAYDAVCTPDFFGFNADLGLQYRGRLDSTGARGGDAPSDLYEAMKLVAGTGRGPKDQTPSMGCSIKWKAA